jgi:peptidyl-prolyl cis-trans isomerase B (cyclophilin B)
MENTGVHIKFTDEQRAVYKTSGGSPHLDYEYTVFGEVVEGFDVLDKISRAETDRNNRPVKDIRIQSISVIE